MIDRRAFLKAALYVAAAPVIVKASSLMKVRSLPCPLCGTFHSSSVHDLTEQSLQHAIEQIRAFSISNEGIACSLRQTKIIIGARVLNGERFVFPDPDPFA